MSARAIGLAGAMRTLGRAIAYDRATYYDCRDSETLSHDTPEEAICELVDDNCTPDCDIEPVLAGIGEVEVTAYNRMEASPRWRAVVTDGLMSQLLENFDEDFGNPAGDGDAGLSEPDRAALHLKMRALVDEFLDKATAWCCEPVGERTYSADEVEAMMREMNPEWFEEPKGAA